MNMSTLKVIYLFFFFALFAPLLVLADRGVVVWPRQINLQQTAQNAIVAWNGQEELLILSTNWNRQDQFCGISTYAACDSEEDCNTSGCSGQTCSGRYENVLTTCGFRDCYNSLRYQQTCGCLNNQCQWKSFNQPASSSALMLEVLPLPAEPFEIKEAEWQVFERLVNLLNKKTQEKSVSGSKALGVAAGAATSTVEIILEKTIGAHDITVVKAEQLNDLLAWIDNFALNKNLETKSYTAGFRNGLSSYLKRDINYFVFDVVELDDGLRTIKPLLYRFKSSELYFPMLISGASEISASMAKVNLFLLTDYGLSLPAYIWRNVRPASSNIMVNDEDYSFSLSPAELQDISLDILGFLPRGAQSRKVSITARLNEVISDFVLTSKIEKNLWLGNRGEEVRKLQRLLINEGCWESDYPTTGYFGTVTRQAVMKLQEKYRAFILEPLGLQQPTGFVGTKTRAFFNDNLAITDTRLGY
jgi:eight-cysteine-cluster-containing protein